MSFCAAVLTGISLGYVYSCQEILRVRNGGPGQAWGVEARVPFLDVDFVAKAMSIPPERKMIHDRHHRREKAYLRQMFRSEMRAIRAPCWPPPSVCGVV
eukprot:COSAG01_NODE_4076_length_5380_cov_5.943950_4_plen_99_part_00